MTINFANQSHTLAAGRTLSGISNDAQKIEIACGRVWLTIAGEDEDFWLQAGESMTVPAHRLIVIEADQQASVVDVKTAATAPVRQSVPVQAGIFQKLSHKLSQTFA